MEKKASGAAATADAEKSFLEIALHYWGILWRYKWIIIGVTGVVTIAVFAFAVISIKLPPEESPLPNTYTAEAVLFIQPNQQGDIADSILTALGVATQSRPATSFNNGDMLLEILYSRTILDKLAEDFKIIEKYNITEEKKNRSRILLINSLHTQFSRTTGSLRITYEDMNPVFARDIVNRTVELLNEWFVQNRGMAKERTKQILEEKLMEVKADIDRLQNRQKDLQRRYGVLNAEELSVSQATTLADLRSQLVMKEIEIKNYSTYARISDPRLEQLNEELRNLQELINRNQTSLPQITEDTGRSRNIADVAQEFSQLANELDIQQRIYNTLSPQYEAAKLSPESESIFSVFELAEIPDVKTGPQRSKMVLMAFGGSLCFSAALALLLNLIEQLKKDYALLYKKKKSS